MIYYISPFIYPKYIKIFLWVMGVAFWVSHGMVSWVIISRKKFKRVNIAIFQANEKNNENNFSSSAYNNIQFYTDYFFSDDNFNFYITTDCCPPTLWQFFFHGWRSYNDILTDLMNTNYEYAIPLVMYYHYVRSSFLFRTHLKMENGNFSSSIYLN